MRGIRKGRSVWAIALTVTATLVLAACGGDGGGGSQELSDEPVTLRFTWWGSDDRHARTKQAIELFREEHPNITIKGEFKEWNGYWDSLATTVAANDAPDIIQMDELYLNSYAQRGALLDLGTASKHLDLAGYDPKVLGSGKIEGKQYGVPTGVTNWTITVNTELMAKYKIPIPDDSTWSWDDLKAAGDRVSKASGGKVRGLQSFGFDTGGLNIWARQAGASLYDAQGKVVIPPPVLASFWTYLDGLAKSGVAPPPSVTVEQASGALEISSMATNTAAFGTGWSSQLSMMTAASGADLKLLKLPGESQAASPGAYLKPSMFWSVSSRTKYPAEAALFVNFLGTSEKAANVLMTDRGFPANSAFRDAITSKLTGPDAAVAKHIEELEIGEPPNATPNGASNIEQILKRHTEQVLFGRMTPDAAATSFIAELQAEIDAA